MEEQQNSLTYEIIKAAVAGEKCIVVSDFMKYWA